MLKKVLNSSKKFLSFFVPSIIFSLNCPVFSQTLSQKSGNSSSSGVSMPTMPTISQPSIGGGFYTPGRSDFYSPTNTYKKQNNTTTSSLSSSKTSSADTSSQTPSISSLTLNENLDSNNSQPANSINLTADDISSMNNLGIFSQLSGLLGNNSKVQNQLLSANNTITANTSDSNTLNQILSELNELKTKVNSSEKKNEVPASETSFSNVVKKEPKILRFIVNGYDLLTTCKKIYFSELETDGTFLLTGDRKYITDNQVRSETFYFYFRASGTDNGITKYNVTPAISQDYENQYSYLYQLTQKSGLVADRTGNLLTLRTSDNNWKLDLLISLDK